MKSIEIDEVLYQYIASQTQYIGESASSILRRLLALNDELPKEATKAESESSPATLTGSVTTPLYHQDIDEMISVGEAFSPSPIVNTKNEDEISAISSSQTTENISDKNVSNEEPDIALVFNYINREELAIQRGAVGRFLLILAALYRVHKASFNVVCSIRGRDRLYFAHSENDLASSGSSTKPRQIPDSEFWVITNSNTTRKKMMLTEAARALGYNEKDTESIRDLL